MDVRSIALFCLIPALINMFVAKKKGRSLWAWGSAGILVSVISIFLLFIQKPLKPGEREMSPVVIVIFVLIAGGLLSSIYEFNKRGAQPKRIHFIQKLP
jgi:peptidoglycan/LPS O-acetylase OafA/YrhL